MFAMECVGNLHHRDDLLTVNNDDDASKLPCNYVIEIFSGKLFAIFSFSVSHNEGMIPSGFQTVVDDPYAMLHRLK